MGVIEMTTITAAKTADDLSAMRGLMRAYLDWHDARYAPQKELLAKYFDYAGYHYEVAALPDRYVAPGGCILLARRGDTVEGGVALRDLGQGRCEMKRMFVQPKAQGRGVGKKLALAVMAAARERGYRTMHLDTGPAQVEAISMYRKLGFRDCPPHYQLPPQLADMLVFMSCDL